MTEPRPDPLIPAECSTAGNDWFPFYFDRLRKSKWWRRASDAARSRNVMMWGEAYKATPAGSLPDDDDELAEAAGFGMDIEAFLLVKADIMAPWVLCSDGRWYHPTVCEVVLDSWAKTSERRKKDAERKARQRNEVRGVTPKIAPVTRDNVNVPRDTVENARDIGTQTQQTGQDIEEEADASLSTGVDEKPEYPEAFEGIWKAYPHIRGRSSKSKAYGYWRRISAGRRELLPSAVARYAREGREPKEDCGAPAMERWLRDQRYLDWLQPIGSTPAAHSWDGPPEIPDALRKTLADQTDGYLRYFTWDAAQRALVTTSPTMLAKLRDSLANLERINVKVLLEKGRAA